MYCLNLKYCILFQILYDTHRLDEAQFISGIEFGTIEYDKRHDLFIVHSKEEWTDEILDRLEGHPLDPS